MTDNETLAAEGRRVVTFGSLKEMGDWIRRAADALAATSRPASEEVEQLIKRAEMRLMAAQTADTSKFYYDTIALLRRLSTTSGASAWRPIETVDVSLDVSTLEGNSVDLGTLKPGESCIVRVSRPFPYKPAPPQTSTDGG